MTATRPPHCCSASWRKSRPGGGGGPRSSELTRRPRGSWSRPAVVTGCLPHRRAELALRGYLDRHRRQHRAGRRGRNLRDRRRKAPDVHVRTKPAPAQMLITGNRLQTYTHGHALPSRARRHARTRILPRCQWADRCRRAAARQSGRRAPRCHGTNWTVHRRQRIGIVPHPSSAHRTRGDAVVKMLRAAAVSGWRAKRVDPESPSERFRFSETPRKNAGDQPNLLRCDTKSSCAYVVPGVCAKARIVLKTLSNLFI